jgi:hypothetical protein
LRKDKECSPEVAPIDTIEQRFKLLGMLNFFHTGSNLLKDQSDLQSGNKAIRQFK